MPSFLFRYGEYFMALLTVGMVVKYIGRVGRSSALQANDLGKIVGFDRGRGKVYVEWERAQEMSRVPCHALALPEKV